MTRHRGHIQFNVESAHVGFYTSLYESLGWEVIVEDDGFTGVRKDGWLIWFTPGGAGSRHDHDSVVINHLGIEADTMADVDRVATWVQDKDIALLYDTPIDRTEFAASDTEMYYSVMFESPDGILLEVVYTGPKTA